MSQEQKKEVKPKKKQTKKKNKKQNKSPRLHVDGIFMGYRRGLTTQKTGTSLIKIVGVTTRKETEWYLGKKVAFVYNASRHHNGSNVRTIWGKITTSHGNSGIVRAKFKRNLPAIAMGKKVRVMMYPSKI
ncbi:60S ribosomal protein L35A [Anaeramoeba flamelloides]|uniref:60S ribosomal protein L35A n=1 Tax=Anaeramoeba flamelloides TaxID=1746091 RepID=A0ABQ8YN07_9EUKA|nr:60S ribosomal protein L35A [Anaeramoeba flamelloides]